MSAVAPDRLNVSLLLDRNLEAGRDDSPAFHATFLGAIRIGAVPIPVNPMDRADNYAYYLDDSYAKLIVVESSLLEKLEPVLAERPLGRALVANGDAGAHTSF